MGKRGPQPKGKVKIKWSANFAYAIGLLVTDGCLYNDGRHIAFVSKDLEQIYNYMKSLNIEEHIGKNKSGYKNKESFRVQISDVLFYDFLIKIGIFPHKSRTIKNIKIHPKYFFDFLRGCFDGDGCFYSYWDPRWKSSYMFYIEFVSASKKHIDWLRSILKNNINIVGHISGTEESSVYQLKYAKKEALEIINKMYYNPDVVCLNRKRIKIQKALKIEEKQQKTYIK